MEVNFRHKVVGLVAGAFLMASGLGVTVAYAEKEGSQQKETGFVQVYKCLNDNNTKSCAVVIKKAGEGGTLVGPNEYKTEEECKANCK